VRACGRRIRRISCPTNRFISRKGALRKSFVWNKGIPLNQRRIRTRLTVEGLLSYDGLMPVKALGEKLKNMGARVWQREENPLTFEEGGKGWRKAITSSSF